MQVFVLRKQNVIFLDGSMEQLIQTMYLTEHLFSQFVNAFGHLVLQIIVDYCTVYEQ